MRPPSGFPDGAGNLSVSLERHPYVVVPKLRRAASEMGAEDEAHRALSRALREHGPARLRADGALGGGRGAGSGGIREDVEVVGQDAKPASGLGLSADNRPQPSQVEPAQTRRRDQAPHTWWGSDNGARHRIAYRPYTSFAGASTATASMHRAPLLRRPDRARNGSRSRGLAWDREEHDTPGAQAPRADVGW